MKKKRKQPKALGYPGDSRPGYNEVLIFDDMEDTKSIDKETERKLNRWYRKMKISGSEGIPFTAWRKWKNIL